jgi:hypothetical protein
MALLALAFAALGLRARPQIIGVYGSIQPPREQSRGLFFLTQRRKDAETQRFFGWKVLGQDRHSACPRLPSALPLQPIDP